MSLDIWFTLNACAHCGRDEPEVYSGNITYNLGEMWRAAGLPYSEAIEGKTAGDLVPALEAGLSTLEAEPDRFHAMNPSNGWGSYDGLLEFTRRMVAAAKTWPKAIVGCSR